MRVTIAPKQTDELVPTAIVHQTAFWGRVSRRVGHAAEAFDITLREPATKDAPVTTAGDFLVLRVPLSPDVECAYVPFGPEVAPDAERVGVFLEQLSRQVRPMLGPRCAFIRWDLPWTSVHARTSEDFTEDDAWKGPPSTHARELRMNMSTEDRNLWKSPRDLLPADSILVDLSAPEDALLARMHHKSRYNVRLAARRGVVVTEGTVADLPAWYDMYLETMARNQLAPLPLAHFVAILEERGRGSASPVETRLLLARHRWQLLAGMLVALAPSRATYLYGASTTTDRHLMAPSALQWAAMRVAKAHGCTEYDMLGAAPRHNEAHPLAGVHRFKIGFGGELVHREGCWDYPYDQHVYKGWRGWEQAQVAARAITSE
jgi:lipid II:glycine glycyltransferase (peptidoglycan interpeptide bridge formation enzyme)